MSIKVKRGSSVVISSLEMKRKMLEVEEDNRERFYKAWKSGKLKSFKEKYFTIDLDNTAWVQIDNNFVLYGVAKVRAEFHSESESLIHVKFFNSGGKHIGTTNLDLYSAIRLATSAEVRK